MLCCGTDFTLNEGLVVMRLIMQKSPRSLCGGGISRFNIVFSCYILKCVSDLWGTGVIVLGV